MKSPRLQMNSYLIHTLKFEVKLPKMPRRKFSNKPNFVLFPEPLSKLRQEREFSFSVSPLFAV